MERERQLEAQKPRCGSLVTHQASLKNRKESTSKKEEGSFAKEAVSPSKDEEEEEEETLRPHP